MNKRNARKAYKKADIRSRSEMMRYPEPVLPGAAIDRDDEYSVLRLENIHHPAVMAFEPRELALIAQYVHEEEEKDVDLPF